MNLGRTERLVGRERAHTHFPMLEQPAELAADVIAFTSALPPRR